ncbi:hypothetical protein SUDANB132_03605 [Streptomyces sp. enrichment culture]
MSEASRAAKPRAGMRGSPASPSCAAKCSTVAAGLVSLGPVGFRRRDLDLKGPRRAAPHGIARPPAQTSTASPSSPLITKFGFRVGSAASRSAGAFSSRARREAASSIRARGAPMQ